MSPGRVDNVDPLLGQQALGTFVYGLDRPGVDLDLFVPHPRDGGSRIPKMPSRSSHAANPGRP